MANKPRPAKDIKPTDLRAKALQEAKTANTKKIASEMKKKAQAQAASKKIGPAKDLNKGGARAKFLKEAKAGKIKAQPPKIINKGLPTAIGSRLMKLGSTAALAATFYLGDTFSTKTGGAAGVRGESDVQPKYGRSLRAEAEARKKAAGAFPTKKNIVGNNPNRGLGTSKPTSSAATPSGSYFVTPKQSSGMTGTGRLRPEVKNAASDFKKKNLAANQKAGKDAAPAAQAPKAATPVIKKPAFKGNWTGAAATEMQKRGGAKIKRPNLLSLFRKKMK